MKFNKFVTRLRGKFNDLFLKTLEKQLVLKQVLTQEDWKEIAPKIKFDYAMDNYFAELKEIEILNEKVNSYQTLLQTGAIGKYYSNKWVRKTIFRQDEEMMAQMDEEIQEEMDNPIYNPPPEQPSDQQSEQPGGNQSQQGSDQQT